jgi:hypothetical protein
MDMKTHNDYYDEDDMHEDCDMHEDYESDSMCEGGIRSNGMNEDYEGGISNCMNEGNEGHEGGITMEIESIELCGNYYYAPDFEIMSYDDKCEKCIECAFCKRSLYEYSYNIITDNKSLLNDNKVIIGKCGHMFHKDCMDSWIKCGNTICPIDKVTWEEYRIADHYTSLPIVNKVKKNNNYRFYNVNKYN